MNDCDYSLRLESAVGCGRRQGIYDAVKDYSSKIGRLKSSLDSQ